MFKANVAFLIILINLYFAFASNDYKSPSVVSGESNELIPNELDVNFELYKPIDPNILEDSLLNVPELITKYGRPAEVHKVDTLDGYILEMHRMARPGGKPVFLMHGLLDSSSTWVIMGPDKGLAYMLWDLGYDVWMGNARGNHYSRNHHRLNPNKKQFWQFSFHEIGTIDLPAMIDHVLHTTSNEKLQYIGHSQGTVAFWVMCSEKPEYADKIISMNALAPVAFLDYLGSPLVKVLAFMMRTIPNIMSILGPGEFLPNTEFLAIVSRVFCKDGSLTQDICSNIIFSIAGFNKKQMNNTMLPVMIGHTPAGAATKQLIHFAQINGSGKFRQFDFGMARNLIRYRSISPPDYNLQNVRVKVALHYSTNDYFADHRDVERLHQHLPMPLGKFLVGDLDFNHLDFVWGIDARPFCYEKVVKLMRAVEDGIL